MPASSLSSVFVHLPLPGPFVKTCVKVLVPHLFAKQWSDLTVPCGASVREVLEAVVSSESADQVCLVDPSRQRVAVKSDTLLAGAWILQKKEFLVPLSLSLAPEEFFGSRVTAAMAAARWQNDRICWKGICLPPLCLLRILLSFLPKSTSSLVLHWPVTNDSPTVVRYAFRESKEPEKSLSVFASEYDPDDLLRVIACQEMIPFESLTRCGSTETDFRVVFAHGTSQIPLVLFDSMDAVNVVAEKIMPIGPNVPWRHIQQCALARFDVCESFFGVWAWDDSANAFMSADDDVLFSELLEGRRSVKIAILPSGFAVKTH